jgi:hypothetical protein
MRFSKPLIGAGLLSLSLVTGAALSGTAFADTPRTHVSAPAPAPAHHTTTPSLKGSESKPKADNSDHHERLAAASVQATVSRSRVRRGESFKVSITTSGVADGTKAVVTGPTGATYRVTVENGQASKTLKVAGNASPGTYSVNVAVGDVSASATVTVVR